VPSYRRASAMGTNNFISAAAADSKPLAPTPPAASSKPAAPTPPAADLKPIAASSAFGRQPAAPTPPAADRKPIVATTSAVGSKPVAPTPPAADRKPIVATTSAVGSKSTPPAADRKPVTGTTSAAVKAATSFEALVGSGSIVSARLAASGDRPRTFSMGADSRKLVDRQATSSPSGSVELELFQMRSSLAPGFAAGAGVGASPAGGVPARRLTWSRKQPDEASSTGPAPSRTNTGSAGTLRAVPCHDIRSSSLLFSLLNFCCAQPTERCCAATRRRRRSLPRG
jgi:hypothetical protein